MLCYVMYTWLILHVVFLVLFVCIVTFNFLVLAPASNYYAFSSGIQEHDSETTDWCGLSRISFVSEKDPFLTKVVGTALP